MLIAGSVILCIACFIGDWCIVNSTADTAIVPITFLEHGNSIYILSWILALAGCGLIAFASRLVWGVLGIGVFAFAGHFLTVPILEALQFVPDSGMRARFPKNDALD